MTHLTTLRKEIRSLAVFSSSFPKLSSIKFSKWFQISILEILEDVDASWERSGSVAGSLGILDKVMLSCDCEVCSNACGCDNENETCSLWWVVDVKNNIHPKLKKEKNCDQWLEKKN